MLGGASPPYIYHHPSTIVSPSLSCLFVFQEYEVQTGSASIPSVVTVVERDQSHDQNQDPDQDHDKDQDKDPDPRPRSRPRLNMRENRVCAYSICCHCCRTRPIPQARPKPRPRLIPGLRPRPKTRTQDPIPNTKDPNTKDPRPGRTTKQDHKEKQNETQKTKKPFANKKNISKMVFGKKWFSPPNLSF